MRFSGHCCVDALFFCQVVQIILVDEHQAVCQTCGYTSRAFRSFSAKVALDYNGSPTAIDLEVAKASRFDPRLDRNRSKRASEHAVVATDTLLLANPYSIFVRVQTICRTRFDAGSINAVMAGDRR